MFPYAQPTRSQFTLNQDTLWFRRSRRFEGRASERSSNAIPVHPILDLGEGLARLRSINLRLLMVKEVVLLAAVLSLATGLSRAADPMPPEGFRGIFNGKDLTAWYGLNPHSSETLEGEKHSENLKAQRADFANHWTVENGELVNRGTGPYATSEEDFGDYQLLLQYKTVAGADSGIYLRGMPQVQIWDNNQVFDLAKPDRRPHLGSGGLFHNTPKTLGRDPIMKVDQPLDQWNTFDIKQIGGRTWVTLNTSLVVDGAPFENYLEKHCLFPQRDRLCSRLTAARIAGGISSSAR